MTLPRFIIVALLASFVVLTARADQALTRREWKVGDLTREALVYLPPEAQGKACPVVFAFHGHGGNMQSAAQMFHIQTLWPEAIVIYMQGVNTPGRLTDPEGKKPGWQFLVGDHGDRDLKFFDTVLASLKHDYKVDARRVYSTGHSNGGAFSYLLWAARPNDFAAFAPSAALLREWVAPPAGQSDMNKKRVPKPLMHFAGEHDPLVKFEWQKLMIDAVRELNQCSEGKPWDQDKRCTVYDSKVGAPVITYIHPGQHNFPKEAPEMIVKFFKASVSKAE